jgi:hypothetical protein
MRELNVGYFIVHPSMLEKEHLTAVMASSRERGVWSDWGYRRSSSSFVEMRPDGAGA